MKKEWSVPLVEVLDIGLTENNILQSPESDGVYAGQWGDNPDGYMCPFSCS